MVNLMYYLTHSLNLTNLFIDIPSLYYANLNSSIICFIFPGDIYLSFGISVLSKLFCECNFLEDFLGSIE